MSPLSIDNEVPVVAENVFTPSYKRIFIIIFFSTVEVFHIIFSINVHVRQLDGLELD